MIGLAIKLDGDNAWPDLADAVLRGELRHATITEVAGLEGGTLGGKPTVAVRIDFPDGTTVVGETTLALFLSAADALRGRYGDPRT